MYRCYSDRIVLRRIEGARRTPRERVQGKDISHLRTIPKYEFVS